MDLSRAGAVNYITAHGRGGFPIANAQATKRDLFVSPDVEGVRPRVGLLLPFIFAKNFTATKLRPQCIIEAVKNMNPFSFIFSYLTWHYDHGSKIVWKSSMQLMNFVSQATGARSILKMFPVPQHLRAVGEGSFLHVLTGVLLHVFALALRLGAVGLSMAISTLALASGVILFIFWLFFPAAIIVLVITMVREVIVELRM